MTGPAPNFPESEPPPLVGGPGVSPLKFMILAGAGATLLFALFAAAIVVLQPERPSRRSVQEVRMTDGTTLVLEKVTFGRIHELELPPPESRSAWDFFSSSSPRDITQSTSRDRIVVWLSRHDAHGRPLQFDWWSHSLAIDEYGCAVEDQDAGYNRFEMYGSTSSSGPRPFAPEPQGGIEAYVVHSALRPFRHSGATFPLQIYNTAGDLVATFNVPNPVPAAPSAWTPEPLPSTKTDGKLAVSLKGLTAKPSTTSDDRKVTQTINVRPEFEIVWDGEPSREWGTSIELVDELGNVSVPWSCDLCPREPAWKLRVEATRHSNAEFEPAEQAKFASIPIPAANTVQLVGQSATIRGTTIEIVSAGGTGKSVASELAPSGSGNRSSSGGGSLADGKGWRVEIETNNGWMTTTIDSPLPRLAFRISGLASGEHFLLRGKDDQGRTVELHSSGTDPLNHYFMQLPPDAKSVELTAIVHAGHWFEFLVKPPEAAPAAATPPEKNP